MASAALVHATADRAHQHDAEDRIGDDDGGEREPGIHGATMITMAIATSAQTCQSSRRKRLSFARFTQRPARARARTAPAPGGRARCRPEPLHAAPPALRSLADARARSAGPQRCRPRALRWDARRVP